MVTVKDKEIKNCAAQILTYFITTELEEGETSVVTKYSMPEYVKKLVFKAHDDVLHDDWRYEFVHDALVLISENASVDYACEGIEPNIYPNQFLSWLSSNLQRIEYLDDATTDSVDTCKPFSGFELLSYAQYKERSDVFNVFLSELERLIEKKRRRRVK